jgi:hypothetical protein
MHPQNKRQADKAIFIVSIHLVDVGYFPDSNMDQPPSDFRVESFSDENAFQELAAEPLPAWSEENKEFFLVIGAN